MNKELSSGELIARLALALVPNIGDGHAKSLLEHFGDAISIFKTPRSKLERIEGIGSVRAKSLKEFRDFERAETEFKFCEQHKIKILSATDSDYPARLKYCYDAPSLLFYKGEADLSHPRIIAIIGTRNHTEMGRSWTEKLIMELSACQALIISGLAYGIDGLAHRYSLRYGLPTVGVMAHGLDRIYPPSHTGLAREMLHGNGGLLTEFFSGTQPDRFNFPLRNRIVAGLCDAVVVIETHSSGGSMITAKIAHSYNREILAIPGRPEDHYSVGCNELIRTQQAIMLTRPEQLAGVMGWSVEKKQVAIPAELFSELCASQQIILELLRNRGPTQVDELRHAVRMDGTLLASDLLQLEMSQRIRVMPGKIYTAI